MTFAFSPLNLIKLRYGLVPLFLLAFSVNADAIQRVFPAAFFIEHARAINSENTPNTYWVASESEHLARIAAREESILLNYYILAYYGHPLSYHMGILGRYPKEELRQRLIRLAAEYRQFSGTRGVRIGFYIIFGTVWPEGEIGYINENVLREWIHFALEHDMLVFIDHQIGRYTPEHAMRRMLPWLHYPNVHLAIDPEWRTDRPMIEIGTVSAAEINHIQQIMEDYIIQNNLPGERLLVVHQFHWRMISQPRAVDTRRFTRVRLVHNASGIGTPEMKRSLYTFTTRYTNMPVNGFKLWYPQTLGSIYDIPLMTPQEVMELHPRPFVIMYQ
ncbi:MAG: hypothetical protein LBG93_10315 [Treponema sp.]|jgi:hypothetical protein|nr:hypothetical protein [Treponema sp.]